MINALIVVAALIIVMVVWWQMTHPLLTGAEKNDGQTKDGGW